MKLENIIKLKLSNFEIKLPKKESYIEPNPCWEGYEPQGMKDKDGRMVPNCVPVKAKKVKQGFPIPSPSGDESKDDYMKRCMGDISGEYDQDQAVAICIKKYEDK